ncbi:MAG: hypothetical protein ABIN67_14385 [Ferruginibacter sp.]
MITEISNSAVIADAFNKKNTTKKLRPFYVRWFFVGMAIVFPIIAGLGFVPDYIMMSSGAFHAHWFAHLHGAVMTLWLLVFLAQAILAAKGNLNYHRTLGLVAVALGILVWLSTVAADVRSRLANSPPEPDDSWDILLIGLFGSILFALFFGWGMFARKNAAVHKRLLLLATIVILQAAIDRIRFLPGLNVAVYVRFIYLDLLLVPLVIYDLLTLKRVHKITLIGAACFILLQTAVSVAAGTPAWHKLAFSVFAPFMKMPVEIKLSDAQIEPLLGYYGTNEWKLNIFREGGKVYIQLPGTPKYVMGAISETEWFLKITSWHVFFIKSADGKVTKIINKQPNINNWEVVRYKQP